MPPSWFVPAIAACDQPPIHTLYSAATGIGNNNGGGGGDDEDDDDDDDK